LINNTKFPALKRRIGRPPKVKAGTSSKMSKKSMKQQLSPH
jgi:hypothetical protein